jgi:hypothetical protein
MRRSIYLVIIIFLLSVKVLVAQSYSTSLGLRLGNNDNFRMGGITLQQQLFNKVTLEGIAQTDFSHNHTLHAMIEHHQNIVSKRLNFYVGAGFSGGIEENTSTEKLYNKTVTTTTYNNKTFGADLIAGLEVTLLKYNIAIDYKPNFNFTGRDSWYQGQIGISLRAVLVSGSAWNKHHKKKKNSGLDNFFDDLFKKDSK